MKEAFKDIVGIGEITGPVLINQPKEQSMSFSQRCYKFESNGFYGLASRKLCYLSDASRHRKKIWIIRLTFLQIQVTIFGDSIPDLGYRWVFLWPTSIDRGPIVFALFLTDVLLIVG